MKLIKISDFHMCLCPCLGGGEAGTIPGTAGGRSETLLDKQWLDSAPQQSTGVGEAGALFLVPKGQSGLAGEEVRQRGGVERESWTLHGKGWSVCSF